MGHDVEVLVVGAGPVGLFMALELARHGVSSVRIVDKDASASIHSKALGVQVLTLEIFEDLGLLGEAERLGRPAYGMNIFAEGKRIAHVDLDDLDSPIGHILVLPQYDTEKILEEAAVARGVSVEREVSLTELSQDAEGITATLQNAKGEAETCRARWLIGCDGAHSTVRRQLGLPYEGEDLGTHIAFADLPVKSSMPDDEMCMHMHADGFVLFIPLPDPGMWRIILSLPDDTEAVLDLPWFRGLIETRLGEGVIEMGEPIWATDFVIRQRKVNRYRVGHAFLAGDAAHCHSPVGGRGMNTGLQDAYNLAWKLAMVIHGVGRSELLDAYQAEREPVAASLLQETGRNTKAITLRHSISQSLRNSMLGVLSSFDTIRRRIGRNATQLDIHYRSSPIVDERRASMLQVNVAPDPDSEMPSLADWRDFGSAPHAGDRATDGALIDENGEVRLHTLFSGTHHTLLLFDGAADTPEGYRRFADICEKIQARYGHYIKTHVILPEGRPRPEALGEGVSIVHDPGFDTHERYGAGAECLYLIRPDGYVGFRSQPADLGAVLGHLDRLFV